MKLWGEFQEKGYTFRAYIPDSANEPIEWYVKVTSIENDQEVIVKELHVPMDYEPRFGPDVSDVERLDQEVNKVIEELAKNKPR